MLRCIQVFSFTSMSWLISIFFFSHVSDNGFEAICCSKNFIERRVALKPLVEGQGKEEEGEGGEKRWRKNFCTEPLQRNLKIFFTFYFGLKCKNIRKKRSLKIFNRFVWSGKTPESSFEIKVRRKKK